MFQRLGSEFQRTKLGVRVLPSGGGCRHGFVRDPKKARCSRKQWYKSCLDIHPEGSACTVGPVSRSSPLKYRNTYPHTEFGGSATTWPACWTVHALFFRVGQGQGPPARVRLRARQGPPRRRRPRPPTSASGRQGPPPASDLRQAGLCLPPSQPPLLHMAAPAAAAVTKPAKQLGREAVITPRCAAGRPRSCFALRSDANDLDQWATCSSA